MSDEYGHRLKAFPLRMEEELRAKLEQEKDRNGRNLNAEINQRLSKSLNVESERDEQMKTMILLLERLNSKIDKIESKLNI